jgi:hypothetical protein
MGPVSAAMQAGGIPFDEASTRRFAEAAARGAMPEGASPAEIAAWDKVKGGVPVFSKYLKPGEVDPFIREQAKRMPGYVRGVEDPAGRGLKFAGMDVPGSAADDSDARGRPTLLGSVGTGAALGGGLVGIHAARSRASEDTVPVKLLAAGIGSAAGAGMGLVLHPLRLAIWRAVRRKREREKTAEAAAASENPFASAIGATGGMKDRALGTMRRKAIDYGVRKALDVAAPVVQRASEALETQIAADRVRQAAGAYGYLTGGGLRRHVGQAVGAGTKGIVVASRIARSPRAVLRAAPDVVGLYGRHSNYARRAEIHASDMRRKADAIPRWNPPPVADWAGEDAVRRPLTNVPRGGAA